MQVDVFESTLKGLLHQLDELTSADVEQASFKIAYCRR